MKNNFDKYNLREVILKYPSEIKEGQKFADHIELTRRNFSNLIICGMGGSALPADLLVGFFEHQEAKKFPLPVYIVRGYDLPRIADENSLIFISSYSGNTEETVSCFEQALKLGTEIVAFAAGGKVEKMAKENKLPLVKYKIDYPHFQPRYATTYAFAAMHRVLTNAELCDMIDKFPEVKSSDLEKRGKQIAKKFADTTILCYATKSLKNAAKTLKIKLNENTKIPAFWNYIPEMNHNEINGAVNLPGSFSALFYFDKDAHPRDKKRIVVTSKLYEEKGIKTEVIELKGETYLDKMLESFVLNDWISYYLAAHYNQDPTPVDIVESLKKKMAR